MKCERCQKELSGIDLYCDRCGKAIFPEYMDEDDIWVYYKSDEELAEILKAQEASQGTASESEITKEESSQVTEAVPEELTEEMPKEIPEEMPEESTLEKEDCPEEEIIPEENFLREEDSPITELQQEKAAQEEPSQEEPFKDEFPKEENALSEEEETSGEKLPESPEADTAPVELSQEDLETLEELSEEDDNIFDDEEEMEEDPPLTVEAKKKRRRNTLLILAFLTLCFGSGIFLGLNRIKEMEKQEKEYYKTLNLPKSQESTGDKAAAATPETPPAKEEQEAEPHNEESQEEKPKEDAPKKEPTKEEKKAEYFKLVNPEEVDFSKYKKIQPAGVEENSVKQSESYDYSGKSAVDGDVSSSWQENEAGLGEGKGLKLTLDGSHKIRYLVLYLGNWRSDELWKYNARPKSLTIQVGENEKKDVEFSNEKKKFCLSFDEPLEASFVSMYIKEAYKGSRWEDNCISEIEIYE